MRRRPTSRPSSSRTAARSTERGGISLVLDERTVDFEADSEHGARCLVAVIRAVANLGEPAVENI